MSQAIGFHDGDYVICRGEASSPFAGFLAYQKGREVLLLQARRIWYWEGAASLSELATAGPARPEQCQFPAPVEQALILDAIELLSVSADAQAAIAAVPVWSAHS